MSKGGFVYILASTPNGTLYVGVTNDIVRRGHQHRTGKGSDFVAEYDVTRLVYLERFDDIETAIRREKQLKAWKRDWKLALIRDQNPEWRDLYDDACRIHAASQDSESDEISTRFEMDARGGARGRSTKFGCKRPV